MSPRSISARRYRDKMLARSTSPMGMRLRFGNYSTRRTSPMTEIGDRVLVVRPDKGNFT
jgi:hypothetical protein